MAYFHKTLTDTTTYAYISADSFEYPEIADGERGGAISAGTTLGPLGQSPREKSMTTTSRTVIAAFGSAILGVTALGHLMLTKPDIIEGALWGTWIMVLTVGVGVLAATLGVEKARNEKELEETKRLIKLTAIPI